MTLNIANSSHIEHRTNSLNSKLLAYQQIQHAFTDSETRPLNSGNYNGSIDTEAENESAQREEMGTVTPPVVNDVGQSNSEFIVMNILTA